MKRKSERKKTPFETLVKAENITEKLFREVLELFAQPIHIEVFDPETDLCVITEKLYPPYAADFIRNRFMELSVKLLETVAGANAIKPATTDGPIRDSEIIDRRLLQDKAISILEALNELCNFTAKVFPLQMHRFKSFCSELEELSGALRTWKRYIPGVKREKAGKPA